MIEDMMSQMVVQYISTLNLILSKYHCHGRAGATSPVGQVSTGPLFSPSALTADLGDYDVRGSIDEVREVLS